jgi:hypothetical protein
MHAALFPSLSKLALGLFPSLCYWPHLASHMHSALFPSLSKLALDLFPSLSTLPLGQSYAHRLVSLLVYGRHLYFIVTVRRHISLLYGFDFVEAFSYLFHSFVCK